MPTLWSHFVEASAAAAAHFLSPNILRMVGRSILQYRADAFPAAAAKDAVSSAYRALV